MARWLILSPALAILSGCSLRSDPELTSGGTGAEGPGAGGQAGAGTPTGGAGGVPECDADLDSDPDNCGACEHACLAGGTCGNGECASELKLSLDNLLVYDLVLEGDHTWAAVNLSGTDLLVRLESPGDRPWELPTVPLHALGGGARGLADSQADVFAATDSQRWRAPKSADPPQSVPVATGPGPDKHLAWDGIRLYETNFAGGLAYYFGDIPTVMWTAEDDPRVENAWAVAATQAFVFWTQRAEGGGVHRSTPAKTITTLAQDAGVPTDIATAGRFVYWTDCAGGRIFRHSTDGDEGPELLVDLPGSHPYGIAVSGDYVYWYDVGAEEAQHCLENELSTQTVGSVWRARISRPQIVLLQSGVGTTEVIEVSGDYVYWCDWRPSTDPPSGTCRRVAK